MIPALKGSYFDSILLHQMYIVYMCIAYIDFFFFFSPENLLCLRLWDDLYTMYSLEREREMSKSTVWLPYGYTYIEGIKETWRYHSLLGVIWFCHVSSFLSAVSTFKRKVIVFKDFGKKKKKKNRFLLLGRFGNSLNEAILQ